MESLTLTSFLRYIPISYRPSCRHALPASCRTHAACSPVPAHLWFSLVPGVARAWGSCARSSMRWRWPGPHPSSSLAPGLASAWGSCRQLPRHCAVLVSAARRCARVEEEHRYRRPSTWVFGSALQSLNFSFLFCTS
jgi:hypothetical protein